MDGAAFPVVQPASVHQVHVLTTLTAPSTTPFQDFHLGRLLVHELRAAQEHDLADSLAWVVLPDRLHWLVALRGASAARLVQRIKARSARAINRALGSCRPIWQAGYHDLPVQHEGDLLTLARQIVAYPRRVGLVRRSRDYPLWDAIWV